MLFGGTDDSPAMFWRQTTLRRGKGGEGVGFVVASGFLAQSSHPLSQQIFSKIVCMKSQTPCSRPHNGIHEPGSDELW